jgi:hypothetical protein
VAPNTRLDELGTELIGEHGGKAALAQGGRREQAAVEANEAHTGSARGRRTQRKRKRRAG